jgi:hypothetical protein
VDTFPTIVRLVCVENAPSGALGRLGLDVPYANEDV